MQPTAIRDTVTMAWPPNHCVHKQNIVTVIFSTKIDLNKIQRSHRPQAINVVVKLIG